MSYAIFRSGGKQFRAEKGTTLRLPTLPGDAGATVEFNEVLLGSDGNNVKVGVPTLKGATVTAEIVKHGLADKIIVFGVLGLLWIVVIVGFVLFVQRFRA